jgi:hypothetical protein
LSSSEVNISGCKVVDAFMITLVIVMFDEGADPGSQVIREEVILALSEENLL